MCVHIQSGVLLLRTDTITMDSDLCVRLGLDEVVIRKAHAVGLVQQHATVDNSDKEHLNRWFMDRMVDGLWIKITSSECWSDLDMSEIRIYPRNNVTMSSGKKLEQYMLRKGQTRLLLQLPSSPRTLRTSLGL